MDYKKLYDALVTIRDTCNEMQEGDGCEKCPMCTEQGTVCCVIDTNPDDWDVIHPEVRLMR